MEINSNQRLAITYMDDGNQDGAGSQLLRIYGIYAISRSLGVPYVHSPIAHLGYHGLSALENNAPSADLLQECNRVFHIPSDIELPEQRVIHNMTDVDIESIRRIKDAGSDGPEFSLIRVLYPYPATDEDPELYRSLGAVSPFRYRKSEVFRLAIHVRRGELFAIYSDWMVPNSYFVGCVLRFQRILRSLDIPFVCELYTEVPTKAFEVTPQHHGIYGRISDNITFDPAMNHLEDFDEIPNLERYVNFDTIESLQRMATADALILSHSSFSYLPAVLNPECIVIYHRYWRSPMKDWLIADDTGAFPEADLVARLESWKRAAIGVHDTDAPATVEADPRVAEAPRQSAPAEISHPAIAPLRNLNLEIEPLLRPFVEQSASIRSIVAFGCEQLLESTPSELPPAIPIGRNAAAFRVASDARNRPAIDNGETIRPVPNRYGKEWTSALDSFARQARDIFGAHSGDDLLLVPAELLSRNMTRVGEDFGFRAVAVLNPQFGGLRSEIAWKLGRRLFDRGLVCVGSVSLTGCEAHCFLAGDAIRSFNSLDIDSRGHITMSTLLDGAGFANQLWRYACVKLYALRHGLTPAFPAWEGNQLFGLEDKSCAGLDFPSVDYPGFAENDREFWYKENPPIDIDLKGFFQEIPECWREQRPLLRNLFQLSPENVRAIDAWRHAVTDGGRRTLVAVSVRRGDYRKLQDVSLPYFRLVPAAWYLDWLRAIWPTLRKPILFVASDESETVAPLFQEFETISATFGLPHHISDFEVLRRADYLAICNSSFPRMAAILAPSTQKCFIPSFATQSFEPYEPWIDPAFWARFANAWCDTKPRVQRPARPAPTETITLPPGRYLPISSEAPSILRDRMDGSLSAELICISGWHDVEVSGVRAYPPTSMLRFRVDAPVGTRLNLVIRLAASGRDFRIRVRAGSGSETEVPLAAGSERLAALSCAVEPGELVTAELASMNETLDNDEFPGVAYWMLKGILYFDPTQVVATAMQQTPVGQSRQTRMTRPL